MITIVRAGAAAPDHKLTKPFWFVVFEGNARQEFGAVLARALVSRLDAQGLEPTPGQLAKEHEKLLRAPLVIAVCARMHENVDLPAQEIISAGAAAAQNMLLAATALGYGSIWRTGESAYNNDVKAALGLARTDFIIGFLYFGSLKDNAYIEPNDPNIAEILTIWES